MRRGDIVHVWDETKKYLMARAPLLDARRGHQHVVLLAMPYADVWYLENPVDQTYLRAVWDTRTVKRRGKEVTLTQWWDDGRLRMLLVPADKDEGLAPGEAERRAPDLRQVDPGTGGRPVPDVYWPEDQKEQAAG